MIPVLDIECAPIFEAWFNASFLTTCLPAVSFTLLDQANQRGANVRVTPIATRFLGFGPAGAALSYFLMASRFF